MEYRTAEVEIEGGRSVTVRSCPSAVLFRYLHEWKANNPEPEKPFRMTKTADKTEEKFELGKDEPEYIAYEAQHLIWYIESRRRYDVAVLVAGVVFDEPEDDSWAAPYRRLDLEFPDKETDYADYLYVYLMTTYFNDPTDSQKVVNKILEISIPQEIRIRAKMRDFTRSGMASRLWMRACRKGISLLTRALM